MWQVEEDGITHINIYSKGKTELGRWLTNFSYSPFNHPEYGKFLSMEGFWYWVSTGMKDDRFRTTIGFKAKELGRTMKVIDQGLEFEIIIKQGIRQKLLSDKSKLRELIECNLPLAHYYVYGGKCVPAGYEWITEYIEFVREACQKTGYKP